LRHSLNTVLAAAAAAAAVTAGAGAGAGAAAQIIDETLPTLLELKQQGTIRAIGITGYPLDIFSYVLDK
jgi:diketogulonate reductase-like aldo/keto reductase